MNELKNRKKQLKKDCDKLEREKEKLMEHLVKMMSESRVAYNFTPCTHALQQHNVRNFTLNIFANELIFLNSNAGNGTSYACLELGKLNIPHSFLKYGIYFPPLVVGSSHSHTVLCWGK